MARATASIMITFGDGKGRVNIPIKIFVAAKPIKVSFGSSPIGPTKGTSKPPVFKSPAAQKDKNKYYDHNGRTVVVPPEVIEEAMGQKNLLTVTEFVPEAKVGYLEIQKSYHVQPDKNGGRGMRLLANSLRNQNKIALGYWQSGQKDEFVGLMPYEDGLIMLVLFYQEEIEPYDSKIGNVEIESKEQRNMDAIVRALSSRNHDPSKYHDNFLERMIHALERDDNAKVETERYVEPTIDFINLSVEDAANAKVS